MIKSKLRFIAAVAAGLASVATGAALTAPAQAATTVAESPAQATAISNTLLPGQRLASGQYIRSTDRQWTLVMRPTGNVELVRTGTGKVWETGTTRAGSVMVMGTDGSFRLVHGRTTYWIGGASASPNAKLVLPTDGLLTIYNGRGRSIWNYKMIIGTMYPGNRIYAPVGWGRGPVVLFSVNRVYSLQMRASGALELMKDNKTRLWSAPYKPYPDSWAFLTTAGTFGVAQTWDTVWTVPTRRSGTVLHLRNDGKLLLIHGRTVVRTLY